MTDRDPFDVKLDNLRLAVEDAETLLKKVLEGIEELRGITREAIAESLTCEQCDAGMELSLAEALQQGWENLQFVPDLPEANYCGTCPSCLAEEDAEIERRRASNESRPEELPMEPSSKPKATLFD